MAAIKMNDAINFVPSFMFFTFPSLLILFHALKLNRKSLRRV